MIGNEKAKHNIQSFKLNGRIEKMVVKNGTYIIRAWRPKDKKQAAINQGLANNPIVKIDESSLRALMALSISIKTRTVKDIVEALAFPTVK